MSKSRSHKEPSNPIGNVAELFAGVGGFRIGLATAGWKTVFSNQWEPSTKVQHASSVYVARFGEEGHSNVDIATIEKLPKSIDLLVGGFPCQDYSVAKTLSTARGLEGKKGVLWWEILRLIESRRPSERPKYVFLENVDRLLKSPSVQRGRDFAVMLRTLGDAGYIVEWRVVNAADYGFPQRRIRVFIVATYVGTKKKKLEFRDVMLKSGILARALPISRLVSEISEIKLDSDVVDLSERFNQGAGQSPFSNSGVYANGIAYTAKCEAKRPSKSQVLGDVLVADEDVPPEYWIEDTRIKDWEYLKGPKSIERTHKESGVKYTYAEGKMAFPDLLTNPSRTILTGEGGSTPSRFKHIIQTSQGYRRLLPIELERLNGFPDEWTKCDHDGNVVPDPRRAFFMGNALVIGLVERVGSVLADEFANRSQS